MKRLRMALYDVACNRFRIKSARHPRSQNYPNVTFINPLFRFTEVQDTNMLDYLYGVLKTKMKGWYMKKTEGSFFGKKYELLSGMATSASEQEKQQKWC